MRSEIIRIVQLGNMHGGLLAGNQARIEANLTVVAISWFDAVLPVPGRTRC